MRFGVSVFALCSWVAASALAADEVPERVKKALETVRKHVPAVQFCKKVPDFAAPAERLEKRWKSAVEKLDAKSEKTQEALLAVAALLEQLPTLPPKEGEKVDEAELEIALSRSLLVEVWLLRYGFSAETSFATVADVKTSADRLKKEFEDKANHRDVSVYVPGGRAFGFTPPAIRFGGGVLFFLVEGSDDKDLGKGFQAAYDDLFLRGKGKLPLLSTDTAKP